MADLNHLYIDQDTGRGISTHSMMKTFRRCPMQAKYKYVELLKPRVLGKPLTQGTWMHRLQEVDAKGGDWKAEHKKLSRKFNQYFDEEKLVLGNLPDECGRMMRSYKWYYKHHGWKVHEVEFMLECEFPDGRIYRAKIDLLVEDQFGLWIVDHKWMASLPDHNFRILDSQSALYIWAAQQNGLDVQGHIWDYGVRKPPTIPKLLKDGSRLYATRIDTDYITFKRALNDYGLDEAKYADQLRALKKIRYRPGEPQLSSHFRRNVLEKTPVLIEQVAREAFHTSKRMHKYPFERNDVERVPDRSCKWCSYQDICTLELMGGNTANIRRQRYETKDPMYYYYDDPAGSASG